MKTLYLECNMGAAGDMLTAALYGLLPDPERYLKTLNALGIPGVSFVAENTQSHGVSGIHMKVTVHGLEEDAPEHHHHHHSTLGSISELIQGLDLPVEVTRRALSVYRRIAQAEAQVHGQPVELVHFHEVGAMDAVADVTAVCYAMYLLNPDRVVVSPVHTGFGFTICAHGRMPVPAPATALLLEGATICAGDVEGELCTPTGAALLQEFATEYGQMPPLRLAAVGIGLGKKEFSIPNCLRAFLGEEGEGNEISELVCNLDDITPEALSHACSRILEAGALDVYTVPGTMKKGRSGHVLTALCKPNQETELIQAVLAETSTNGLRVRRCERPCLDTEIKTVQTPWGPVRVKIASGYGVCHRKPEFDDVSALAHKSNLPFQTVYDAAARLAEDIF